MCSPLPREVWDTECTWFLLPSHSARSTGWSRALTREQKERRKGKKGMGEEETMERRLDTGGQLATERDTAAK